MLNHSASLAMSTRVLKALSGKLEFGPKVLAWQDLCRGPLDIVAHLIYKLWA